MMKKWERQAYRALEPFEAFAAYQNPGDPSTKHYWINKGDTYETNHGIYSDDYVGATIIVEAFGEVQVDGVHILEHSEPIPVSEYDQLHPFVGKVDPETGEWEGTGIEMLY